MIPLSTIHTPTSSDAELDELQQLCERLAGFDERISLEWLDGAMTALAAGPVARPVIEWRDRLIGEAWSRAIADPEAERAAMALLQARWSVLLRQLDPELLFDAIDDLRLAPVMLEWTDEDRERLVAEGHVEAGDDEALPLVGEVWAHGFMEVLETFVDDWPEPDTSTELGESFDQCTLRIAMLAMRDEAELKALHDEFHDGEVLSRDDLIQEALYAVQDLRMYWVENAPKPETRRVGPQPGRNDPCPCGSGRKFKKCHGA